MISNRRHSWKIHELEVKGNIKRSLTETRQAGWHNLEEIKKLAKRTEEYLQGNVTEDEWQANPGIETVWYKWFKILKLL